MTIKNRRDFYIGVVFQAVALAAIIYGAATTEESGLTLSRGSMTPTSYPNFTLVLMWVLAVLLISANLSFSGSAPEVAVAPPPTRLSESHPTWAWRRASGAICLTALYPLLMPFIGYPATNIILMIAFIRLFGGKNLKVIIPLSVGLTAALYWFFAKVMGVMMP